MTKTKNSTLPRWVVPLLQGLSYWVGYKKQFFPYYDLSEGALVAEATQFISSKLESTKEQLKCEVYYKEIIANFDKEERADIVISENDKIKYVVEVKRSKSSQSLLEKDFEKLSRIKIENKRIRCFALVISQGDRPRKFVNEKGLSNKKVYLKKGYKVKAIRVCKTSQSFLPKTIERANYSILIEIL
jgi:hypothetical protein